MADRPTNRTEELRRLGVRRVVHIAQDAREFVPAADFDAIAAEVDRLRAAAASPTTNPPEIGSKSVGPTAEPIPIRPDDLWTCPLPEHWRMAIEEWEGRMLPSPRKLKQICDLIEQRARELASDS